MTASHPISVRRSQHVDQRLRQRGYRERDIDLVRRFGQPVADGVVLLQRDVDRVCRKTKRLVRDLERLAGTAVIEPGDTVLSMYRPSKSKLRHMLASI